ncbi:hypothetical protein psyc5s11_43810 [Clostridium gelidum]|uniref:Uncharacterized protein n=1 Tax=Clostridium gelidum TaxID=704125 RepID=A0ABN6J6J5_9CLOT|nr:hypothetical protein [Clostridium gelidum]BCZ48314.1 hypothetical protein psyc5s11_43810 [Clostridium gelidum]
MNLLITIISFVLLFGVIVVAYVVAKKYIFVKVRITKWIPLSISIILFAAQIFADKIFPYEITKYISYGLSIFAVLFFLWFMDIMQTGGPKKKEKQIVIKPKAKPNRVKKR